MKFLKQITNKLLHKPVYRIINVDTNCYDATSNISYAIFTYKCTTCKKTKRKKGLYARRK